MIDLPDNWERCESEYFKHHAPYDECKCEECGNHFEQTDKDEVFCSKRCYNNAKADYEGKT